MTNGIDWKAMKIALNDVPLCPVPPKPIARPAINYYGTQNSYTNMYENNPFNPALYGIHLALA
ncbi:hypothetical protein UA24_10015 [Marinomonas sp. BSi20414]|nr:hypothetical protein [Marinomonas sp. BSi20414]GGN22004.1 hypothetical protein GCM10011350_09470 [Marinomonas arctica]